MDVRRRFSRQVAASAPTLHGSEKKGLWFVSRQSEEENVGKVDEFQLNSFTRPVYVHIVLSSRELNYLRFRNGF